MYWQDLIRKLLTVDPLQRLTASQAADHDWLKIEENNLSSNDLMSSVWRLQVFNAKKKFRGIIRTVRTSATVRFYPSLGLKPNIPYASESGLRAVRRFEQGFGGGGI